MKKVIAVLVIMGVFSTTLFAAPLSVAGSWDTSSQEVSRTELSAKADALNEFDDLFADVQAVALTPEEATAVEGDGFFGAIFGAAVGAFIGASTGDPTSAAVGAALGGIF
jgi:uncharacterized protein YcfJ